MTRASYLLLAGLLAGCAASTPTPSDTRNERDRPLYRAGGLFAAASGPERPFGSGFDAEWRKLGGPEPAPAAAADPKRALTPEEREFEDWRAWQEWKRRNPK